MWTRLIPLLVILSTLLPVAPVSAKTAAETVAGRVVVDPTQPADFWFVHSSLGLRQQLSASSISDIIARSSKIVTAKEFDSIPSSEEKTAPDAKLLARVKGKIVLDISTGVQWYISPRDSRRYMVRTGEEAQQVFRLLKQGISSTNLAKIPTATETSEGSLSLRRRLSGQVVLSVSDGTLWYISPKNRRRYEVSTPAQALSVARTQYIGIRSAQLAKIPTAAEPVKSSRTTVAAFTGKFILAPYSSTEWWYVSPKTRQRHRLGASPLEVLTANTTAITTRGLGEIRLVGEADYTTTSVVTSRGTFSVLLLTADLALPGMRFLTVGGDEFTCLDNCTAISVGEFAQFYDAIVGVNGGYFCPAGSSGCVSKTDSYYGPLFHSGSRTMINQEQVATSPYPMLVFDTANQYYYFPQASQFGSVEQFESMYRVTIQAAIANWPALIENGINVGEQQLLDSGQRNTKATRVGFGVRGKTIVIAIVSSATVPDLAAVMETMGLEYAINLDGGSSTALWRYGTYLHGPGRTVPNALVIQRGML